MGYMDIKVVSYLDMKENEKVKALDYMRTNDKLQEDYIKDCIYSKIYDQGRGMFFAFNEGEVIGKGFFVMETLKPLGCAYIHKVSAINSYFENTVGNSSNYTEQGILQIVDSLKTFGKENGAMDIRLGFSDNPSQIKLMELFKNQDEYKKAYRSFVMKLDDNRRNLENEILELRDIKELSIEEYINIYNDSFEGAPHRSFMGDLEALEAFEDKEGVSHFIVWDNGVKIGFLDFCIDTEHGIGKFDLGIIKCKRGMGYGKEILETAIQYLVKNKLQVELIVLEPNTVAYEMYKKRGFKISIIMGHWIKLSI